MTHVCLSSGRDTRNLREVSSIHPKCSLGLFFFLITSNFS
ncbi:unnamed protein product [Gulo gulo]|uniref:Uncharacterized protein n=1 Tax=Gulo gulo TaxID=48420 RepID=A0A9X9PXP1_GULGU|nr:unnamed protein product [Gulo gulo]